MFSKLLAPENYVYWSEILVIAQTLIAASFIAYSLGLFKKD